MRWLYGLFLLFSFPFISCEELGNRDVGKTYFGGQIINPNTDYVLLFRNEKVVDTAKLNGENKFLIEIDTVSEGLYRFEHYPEYQYVIIERGDSILLRLNTLDFDESLVYSGRGATKNNFLIDMFLANEDDDYMVQKLYWKDADTFEEHLDSIRKEKLIEFENLKMNGELSEMTQHLLRASIDYTHYARKELYPYRHKIKNNLSYFAKLPEGFYEYRTGVDLNDRELCHFRPYLSFLLTHISHISYSDHGKMCGYEMSTNRNIRRLEFTDSLIVEEDIKNIILQYIAYDYLLSNRDMTENEKFLGKYFEISTNNEFDQDIDRLYHNIQNLQTGNELPEVPLINTESQYVDIKEATLSAPTMYYFWSFNQKGHMKKVLAKASKLQKEYPYVRFVGINTNKNHGKWLNAIAKLELDPKHQYRCEDFYRMREDLVLSNYNKVLVADGEGMVIDGFANIWWEDLHHTLSTLQ